MTKPIHIIGAGMAGSEAAWQAVNLGVPVILHEMRPQVGTDAHRTGGFAELVCSNSFRSDDSENNAVGLLHWEMRRSGSLIMAMADRHQVPAGGALAKMLPLFRAGLGGRVGNGGQWMSWISVDDAGAIIVRPAPAPWRPGLRR